MYIIFIIIYNLLLGIILSLIHILLFPKWKFIGVYN
jgi:hypothetical protein